MSESNPSHQPPLESRRVPLEREVVLEFEHFSNFISEYSANISIGGMFVKTDQPHLPETVFHFEVRLADDGPLIAGLAKVLWVRQAAEGADRPAGMGVRFLQLENDGRGLIEQIVREHVVRGGRPFELEEAAAGERAAEAAAAAPAAGPATPATRPAQPAEPPVDRSAVVELPPLEELLEKTRAPSPSLTLGTPPRGWKPGISVARPRTRPQLIATIAIAAAIVGAAVYLLMHFFAGPPVLDETETQPPERPRAAAPAGDAAVEPQLAPFTGVEEITWQRAGNGAEILVRLDGSLAADSWSVDRMSDPPRHLLKLSGASRPYPTDTFPIGFGGVRQLRTGFHDTGAGNEQHVVIDLVDPRVVLDEAVVEGPLVRLRFRQLNP